MKGFFRISALLWADILVAYALFVMQNYLTDVWKLSVTHAAGILNVWGGISMILPVFILVFVDQILGNFKMVMVSSIAYSLGIGFIAMSTPPVLANSTNTCKQYEPECIGHTQKVLFYAGMALVAVGRAGNLVSVKPFMTDQEDKTDVTSVMLPGLMFVAFLPIIAALAIPYIKPWSLRFGIPAICTLTATLLFWTGSCSYNKVAPEGVLAVRLIPLWLTFLIWGVVSSLRNTYFIEQAKNMDRNIGKWKVPLQIFLLLYTSARAYFSTLINKLLRTSNKYGPPIGIGIAMIFSILCCITAARIEKRRINVIIKHGLLDKPDEDIPMSVYWLFFQYILLAGVDSFFEKSVFEFYKDQAPVSMTEYVTFLTDGVSGLGFMFSVLSVHVVGKVSERGGRTNWFQHTLNRSRLDRYYWVLAALSSANLVVFVLVAFTHRYKDREALSDEEDQVDTAFML